MQTASATVYFRSDSWPEVSYQPVVTGTAEKWQGKPDVSSQMIVSTAHRNDDTRKRAKDLYNEGREN